jgi:hypothetical protein
MFQIIQTNHVERSYPRRDPVTGAATSQTLVTEPDRVIAEHNSKETTERHCVKLRKCHKYLRWEVVVKE